MRYAKVALGKWLKIARVIGNFQGQVILTLFYFVLVLPFGLIISLFSDPLKMKSPLSGRSNFGKWKHEEDDLEKARRQY